MNPRVVKVNYQNSYRLIITFSNNEIKEFDLTPYLGFPVFESLQDESFCSKVKVFNGTIAWSDEIDFDPDRLYLEGKRLDMVH